MSVSARPRGPLPARVYWFRRSLVLAVVLGMVFGVAQLVDGGEQPPKDTARAARAVGAEAQQQPEQPRSTADAEPTTEKRADRKKKREPSPTKTPLAEPTGPCDNSEIVVQPKVRGEAHAGSRVRFRLLLTTVSTPACTWKVSPRSLVVSLTSGNDRIWSSQDCPGAIPELDVVVRKDHPAKVSFGWRGQRSDSTCSRTTSWAQPGWYHIRAAAFGAEPTDLQFELQQPVPPTITPEPKPEKQKSAEKEPEKKPSEEKPSDEEKPQT